MSVDMLVFFSELQAAVAHADKKHGGWQGKTHKEKLEHIKDELDELETAVDNKDINGPHGMKAEVMQVACTAFKFWRMLK